jgi:hypothetical protein
MDLSTTPSIAPKTVLATFPSKSRPGHVYHVKLGADGVVYCDCPSWRFQKNHPSCRCCKHTKALLARASHGGVALSAQGEPGLNPEPKAIRAPRRSRKPARTFWERF